MNEIIPLQFLGRIWHFGDTTEVYVDMETGKTYKPVSSQGLSIEELEAFRDGKGGNNHIIGQMGDHRGNKMVYQQYTLADFTNQIYEALREGMNVFENIKGVA